jgi:hypothetical protein
VTFKGTSGGELAEFVTYHIFGDVNGDVFAPVMNREGVTYEFGEDGACPAPSLEDFLFALLVEFNNALEEDFFDERTLFNTS